MTETIQPATWTVVLGLVFGAISMLIPPAVALTLYWLNNLRVELQTTRLNLLAQQQATRAALEENTAVTRVVEKQTNGALEAARREAVEWRVRFDRLHSLLREVHHDPTARAAIESAMERRRGGTDEHFSELTAELMQPERRRAKN